MMGGHESGGGDVMPWWSPSVMLPPDRGRPHNHHSNHQQHQQQHHARDPVRESSDSAQLSRRERAELRRRRTHKERKRRPMVHQTPSQPYTLPDSDSGGWLRECLWKCIRTIWMCSFNVGFVVLSGLLSVIWKGVIGGGTPSPTPSSVREKMVEVVLEEVEEVEEEVTLALEYSSSTRHDNTHNSDSGKTFSVADTRDVNGSTTPPCGIPLTHPTFPLPPSPPSNLCGDSPPLKPPSPPDLHSSQEYTKSDPPKGFSESVNGSGRAGVVRRVSRASMIHPQSIPDPPSSLTTHQSHLNLHNEIDSPKATPDTSNALLDVQDGAGRGIGGGGGSGEGNISGNKKSAILEAVRGFTSLQEDMMRAIQDAKETTHSLALDRRDSLSSVTSGGSIVSIGSFDTSEFNSGLAESSVSSVVSSVVNSTSPSPLPSEQDLSATVVETVSSSSRNCRDYDQSIEDDIEASLAHLEYQSASDTDTEVEETNIPKETKNRNSKTSTARNSRVLETGSGKTVDSIHKTSTSDSYHVSHDATNINIAADIKLESQAVVKDLIDFSDYSYHERDTFPSAPPLSPGVEDSEIGFEYVQRDPRIADFTDSKDYKRSKVLDDVGFRNFKRENKTLSQFEKDYDKDVGRVNDILVRESKHVGAEGGLIEVG